jgi:hypothetical protein
MRCRTTRSWDELKGHIDPAAMDSHARSIGLFRITRNEDAFMELTGLRRMQGALNATLSAEIEKKNPSFLASPQRTAAINRAVKFLDSLRAQGDSWTRRAPTTRRSCGASG